MLIIQYDTDRERLRRWLAIPTLGGLLIFWLAFFPVLIALFAWTVLRFTHLPASLTAPTPWIAAGAALAVPWNRQLERRRIRVRLMFLPSWLMVAMFASMAAGMALLEACHLAGPFFQ